VEKHHHFIDEETGEVHDVPWAAVKVSGQRSLEGYEVVDYQVVMRGKRRAPQPARRARTRRIR
jgi:Fe2+ or Zn2+ uptake regulation protein